MHIVCGELTIKFYVQHCVLCFDQLRAVIDSHSAAVNGRDIGYAAAAWIVNVLSNGRRAEGLAFLHSHFSESLYPEEILSDYGAVILQHSFHRETTDVAWDARTGVLVWRYEAQHPLEHRDCAAWEGLSPAPSCIGQAVLIWIDESHRGGIPPYLTHMLASPGSAAQVDTAAVVACGINSANVVNVLPCCSQYFALQGIKEIQEFSLGAADEIIQEHGIQQPDVHHRSLGLQHFPSGSRARIVAHKHPAIVGLAVKISLGIFVAARRSHVQQPLGVIDSRSQIVQRHHGWDFDLLCDDHLIWIGKAGIGCLCIIIHIHRTTAGHFREEICGTGVKQAGITVKHDHDVHVAIGSTYHDLRGIITDADCVAKTSILTWIRTYQSLCVGVDIKP